MKIYGHTFKTTQLVKSGAVSRRRKFLFYLGAGSLRIRLHIFCFALLCIPTAGTFMQMYQHWFLANFLCTKYTKCINIHYFLAVLRIHDILVWIRIQFRIRGSMPLTNRSGSGSCYFRHWPSRRQQKTNSFYKFFCLLLVKGIFTSFFKDKK